MNTKRLSTIIPLSLVIVVTSSVFFFFVRTKYDSAENTNGQPSDKQESPPNSLPGSAQSKKFVEIDDQVDAASNEQYAHALKTLFFFLERLSDRVVHSPREKLSEPLENLDYGKISQVLVEIVYQDPWKESKVIEILDELVRHEDKWIRYRAISYLYRMGREDIAKFAAIDLISSPSPVVNPNGGDEDLRITLANALGFYRDAELFPSFVTLYKNTASRKLRDDLMMTSPDEGWSIIGGEVPPRASKTVLEWYGMAKLEIQSRFIEEVFHNETNDAEVRNAAAWALTRLEDHPSARSFIRDYAKRGAGENFGGLPNLKASILYLGTMVDQESVGVLEEIAQNSSSGPVTDVAVANLVINHRSRSEVGKDMVIAELIGGGTPLSRDLAIKLAAYMSDDPEVLEAGEKSDRASSVNTWKTEGIGHKDWSFWGWAHHYLILPPLE